MLKARWQIAVLAGIPVRLHVSFILVLGIVVVAALAAGHGAGGGFAPGFLGLGEWLFGLGIVVAAYSCVVLHELGHCLVARRFGIETVEIVLLPIGGIAFLRSGRDAVWKSERESAHDELRIALAGPAVNAVIATLLGVLLVFELLVPGGWAHEFLVSLFVFNLGMCLFNLLLPAFPMDGGRVVRALLTPRVGKYRATQLAMKLGRVLAVLMAVLSAFVLNPILLFIAGFIWVAAGMEARNVPRPV